jgi:putative selenate reductase molybdopterin-binding subunit
VSLDKITVTSGDTDITPFDVGAYASSTTIISGGAVKKTAEKVRDHIVKLASKMLNVPPENLICRDNQVVAKCGCDKSVTIADLAMHATYREKLQIIDSASHFITDSPPPFCAQFADVEVDTETGEIRVLHLVTAVDCGVPINPKQAEGQAEGAVAQSLGYGFTEEMVLDRQGRMINPSFLDYKILSSKDMPKLTTILVETEEPLGPYGAKSIGEVAINTATPAVLNAVFHATGIRFTKLPVRPEDVLRALSAKGDA